jgi:hypothetical protein
MLAALLTALVLLVTFLVHECFSLVPGIRVN